MSITVPNLKHSFIFPVPVPVPVLVPFPDPVPVPVPDPVPDFRVFHTPAVYMSKAEVSTKARSPSALLAVIGLPTKHTTAKWH